jgi:hypothetical protein
VREEHDAPQALCLVFSLSTSASRGSEEVLWRGAVAVVLADLLEAAGFRVELWAVNHARRGYEDGSDAFQVVRLKAGDSPVDIATLVNGIAGWFFRTVVFQGYHVETQAEPCYTLGSPLPVSAESPLVQELAGNARVVAIDGVWCRVGAEAKVKEVMSELS